MELYDDKDENLKQSDQFVNYKSQEPVIEYESAHQRCKSKTEKLIHSKAFHITIVVLCVLDGLLVIAMLMLEIETLKLAAGSLHDRLVMASFVLECISLVIVSLFLLEIPLKIWVLGFGFYCKHWVELLDLTVCVVSFAVDVYNIQRHIVHEKHAKPIQTHAQTTAKPDPNVEQQIMHDTIADVAGLVVLFRLWRVVRIVNAILVTVSETHESQVHHMKQAQQLAENRIRHLEQALWERGIPIPAPSNEVAEHPNHSHRHQHNNHHHHHHQRHHHLSVSADEEWTNQSKHSSIYENA